MPVLEWAGRNPRFPHLRSSVDFVLALAMLSSLAAATLGWCLARSGGYSGRLVTQHMWGGVSVAAACWLCWMLRGHFSGPVSISSTPWRCWPRLGWCRGRDIAAVNYRKAKITSPNTCRRGLRKLIGLPGPAPLPRSNPAFFYGAHVEPIFINHCYSCHGPDKQKGRLRLDSYELLMRGGKARPRDQGRKRQRQRAFSSRHAPAFRR